MGKGNVYDSSSLAERRYRTARSGLLGMMLFTVVNTVMAATGSESYFVFSDYLAYYCAVFGRVFYEDSGEMLYLIVGCVLAAVLLVPYLLCWILSKKRRGALIAALVMFVLDTLLVIWDAVTYREISYLLDVGFHIWLLVELFLGIRSGKQALEEMNAPASVVKDTEFYDASVTASPDTVSLGMPQEERKYRVIVEAVYAGRTIQVRRSYGLTELVIDGRLYGKWEGLMEKSYEITAQVDGHEVVSRFLPTGRQTIEVDGAVIAKKQRLF